MYEECKYCKPIAGITYQDGAKKALSFIGQKDFTEFMNTVFAGDIDGAMKLKSKYRLAFQVTAQ